MGNIISILVTLLMCFLLGLLAGMGKYSVVELESNVKLEPKLIITKQGVKTDTLYVYEKK